MRVVNPSNNKSKIVLALLDTGSDRDIVAKNVLEELDMGTWTETLTVKTLDCYTSGEPANGLTHSIWVDNRGLEW